MTRIPIKRIVLEAPDCGGKTTLYRSLHSLTKFQHNIHDRSFLSMVAYARLYGRDESRHRLNLLEELTDGNNVLVVLSPPRDVLLSRLHQRGDDAQDESSLMRLCDVFDEEVDKIKEMPNVLIQADVKPPAETAADVNRFVSEYSSRHPWVLGGQFPRIVSASNRDELQYRVDFHVDPGERHHDALEVSHERDYYRRVLNQVWGKIHAESVGLNPQKTHQEPSTTRRFFYADDTCISSIHFLLRGEELLVDCVMRSTDAVRNGACDVKFLCHVATETPRRFKWVIKNTTLRLKFNSLHVLRG